MTNATERNDAGTALRMQGRYTRGAPLQFPERP
jgi:hypothetical protein